MEMLRQPFYRRMEKSISEYVLIRPVGGYVQKEVLWPL